MLKKLFLCCLYILIITSCSTAPKESSINSQFIEITKNIRHQESVRLKTVTWNDAEEVITLKIDNQYWPAYEIVRENNTWKRVDFGL